MQWINQYDLTEDDSAVCRKTEDEVFLTGVNVQKVAESHRPPFGLPTAPLAQFRTNNANRPNKNAQLQPKEFSVLFSSLNHLPPVIPFFV